MFERKPMERILDKMISWTRGSTDRLTDFRVGSKVRTLYESVAVVVEEFYEKMYRAMKTLIEENIYAVIGFDKLPATYASGTVRFGRKIQAERDIYIPAGTTLKSIATQYKAPMKYRTTEDAVLAVGQTFVDVPVIAIQPGVLGNAGAGDISDFEMKPNGIDTVTNMTALLNGKEEETKEEQKARFQQFIQSHSRGVLQSVRYGASTATVEDSKGVVKERVVQCTATEDLVNKVGQVDVHIWNGVGNASEELKTRVKQILTGEFKEDGTPIYGYKPAGIIPNVYTAVIVHVTIKVVITHGYTTTVEEVRSKTEQEIDRYFSKLGMGESLIQTALEANIKYIEGVQDVKLMLSTDNGSTYHTDNILAEQVEIIVPKKPIRYE